MPIQNDKNQPDGKQPELNVGEKPKESKPSEAIYFMSARRGQIGNWRKEKRDGAGNIIQPEGSIQFEECLKVTSDQEMIAFIESSESFANGTITKCRDMEHAQQLVAQRAARKNIRMETAEDVSRSNVAIPE
jgi:hypothetical protein